MIFDEGYLAIGYSNRVLFFRTHFGDHVVVAFVYIMKNIRSTRMNSYEEIEENDNKKYVTCTRQGLNPVPPC